MSCVSGPTYKYTRLLWTQLWIRPCSSLQQTKVALCVCAYVCVCSSEASVPLVMLTQQQQLLLLWPRDCWKYEKNSNLFFGVMWTYITHRRSLWLAYAASFVSLCKANKSGSNVIGTRYCLWSVLEKLCVLSEMFTGITEKGASTQSEWLKIFSL